MTGPARRMTLHIELTKVISFQALGSLYGIETVDFAAAPSQMPNDKKPDVQILKYDMCVR